MLPTYHLIALPIAAIVCTSIVASEAPNDNEKMSPAETDVRKVVQQHFDGIVNADLKQLQAAWDCKVGTISFVTRGDDGEEVVRTAPIRESFKLWTAEKLRGTQGTIQSVDIVHEKMALVKAKITWNRQVYEDYLVLLKTGDKWKLVSKTYTSQQVRTSPYGFIGLSSPNAK